MSAIRRLASYRALRRSLLREVRAYRMGHASRSTIRRIQGELANTRMALTGPANVSEIINGAIDSDERRAVEKAKRMAGETGQAFTVWHDCAALEAFIRPGTTPCPDRSCQRVATVTPLAA